MKGGSERGRERGRERGKERGKERDRGREGRRERGRETGRDKGSAPPTFWKLSVCRPWPNFLYEAMHIHVHTMPIYLQCTCKYMYVQCTDT